MLTRTFPAFLSRALAVLFLVSSLVACGGKPHHRVLVLGLDGTDPRAVDLLISEGRMPNFTKLRSEGAYGRLRSMKPLLSPVVWTTIATGKSPEEHGIGHFVAVDEKTGEQLPATSDMRKVKAIWNIASEKDKKVATVGYWATWPPEEVNGSVVSDHTAYHFLFEEGANGGPGRQVTTYPPELQEKIAGMVRRPTDVKYEELRRFVDVSPEAFAAPFNFEDELSHFKWAYATAESYRDIGLQLWRDQKPDLEMVYIEATDSTAHLFGHLFRATDLGGELATQQQKYGHAVEEMYVFADEIVGKYLAAMDDDTTLVVLSDHGFDLGQLNDDPSKTRDLRRVSEHFHNIEGIVYIYGAGVKPRSRLDQPTVLDIAPTVLALLGIEPADDMPGRVLGEAFSDDLVDSRVASYEPGGGRGAVRRAARDTGTDKAQLEHLKSLGYLGGNENNGAAVDGSGHHRSPQGDRNLAAMHFESGRYAEAEALYRDLIKREPTDASLHTSLAGVLGAQQRYDEAEAELNKALEITPLNPEAFHNLAVIAQRKGNKDKAIELYRSALRANPGYEPSANALRELTGSSDLRPPRSSEEQQAAGIAEAASMAAKRGSYDQALKLLDQAEQMAPELPLVYQYRANVAYLMGDKKMAIAALEKAIKLEPDNILYRENLKRLRESDKPR